MHQQPCHMLLGGSVMPTGMHGSCTGHRGSRLAPLLAELSVLKSWLFFCFVCFNQMWLCRSHSVCHQWDTSVANTLFPCLLPSFELDLGT